jgi:hypothetical protein
MHIDYLSQWVLESRHGDTYDWTLRSTSLHVTNLWQPQVDGHRLRNVEEPAIRCQRKGEPVQWLQRQNTEYDHKTERAEPLSGHTQQLTNTAYISCGEKLDKKRAQLHSASLYVPDSSPED